MKNRYQFQKRESNIGVIFYKSLLSQYTQTHIYTRRLLIYISSRTYVLFYKYYKLLIYHINLTMLLYIVQLALNNSIRMS
jgi:hypothetical protein